MTAFTIHTLETAPVESRETLINVKSAFGTIPNLHAIMAESPELLEAQQVLSALFDLTSFDALEKQVVSLTIIYENECAYCMAGHSMLATMQCLPSDVIDALREGRPIADPKLEALRALVWSMTRHRGSATDAEIQDFLDAGYSRKNVLEIVLAIATKVSMTHVNRVADTPNDTFMKGFEWVPPRSA